MLNDDRMNRLEGFTLYEVLISAIILAMGMIGALALFPKALETQQIARQKLYATSIAMSLVNSYSAGYMQNNFSILDDISLTKTPNGPDLERLGNVFFSFDANSTANKFTRQDTATASLMEPVPFAILRRLDSPDDEIARLVEQGSPVYYPRAFSAHNKVDGVPSPPAGESTLETINALIYAVVGYPQVNASFHYPSCFHQARKHGTDEGADAYWGRRAIFPNWGTRFRSSYLYVQTNTLGAMPRHGYFWEHEINVLDAYSPWPKIGGIFDPSVDIDSALARRGTESDSLHAPFKPSDRCRQIVFWSVDWKNYEDAESTMSERPDIALFNTGNLTLASGGNTSQIAPPKNKLYEDPRVPPQRYENNLAIPDINNPVGFDRNFNDKIDIGRIPPGVRLRAKEVARFNYYDKRLYTLY